MSRKRKVKAVEMLVVVIVVVIIVMAIWGAMELLFAAVGAYQ
jgi:preprotein translocase subunit SecE